MTLNELPELECGTYTKLDSDDKYLTKEELKTIYELLEHEYISYENIAAIQLVRKIRNILNEK